jgi:hypothetical protein
VSDGIVAYDDNVAPQGVYTDLAGVHIDAENMPILDVEEGGLHETARLVHASITGKPAIQLDVRIRGGAASRMSTVIESDLDADVSIALESHGSPTRAPTVHTASVPLYTSPLVPLPERRVGRVPVTPQVQFVVTIDCAARFDGETQATMGLHVHGHVRVAASYENGAWTVAPAPIDATPRVSFARPMPLSARCALTTHATVGAYAASGVTMAFAPYVDLAVDAHASGYSFSARAGTEAGISAQSDVFGLAPKEAPAVTWNAPSELNGKHSWPDRALLR